MSTDRHKLSKHILNLVMCWPPQLSTAESCSFTIYWVKKLFLLLILELMLSVLSSVVVRNNLKACSSYWKAARTWYKQPQDKCTEGVQVTRNPQGTSSYHCLVELCDRLPRACRGSKPLRSGKAWDTFWLSSRGGRGTHVLITILSPLKLES